MTVLAAGKCHCFSTESFPANGVTLNSQGSRKQCRNSARARALPKDCSSFVLKFYCGHQTQPAFYSQFSLSLGKSEGDLQSLLQRLQLLKPSLKMNFNPLFPSLPNYCCCHLVLKHPAAPVWAWDVGSAALAHPSYWHSLRK